MIVKVDLKDRGYEGVDWIDLAQDKDVIKTVMNLGVRKKTGNFLIN
jgi:hypothetical protein